MQKEGKVSQQEVKSDDSENVNDDDDDDCQHGDDSISPHDSCIEMRSQIGRRLSKMIIRSKHLNNQSVVIPLKEEPATMYQSNETLQP